MEKLELKHMLQHVIQGVEIEILNYKCDYVGIQYAKSNGYYFLNNELHITYEGGSTGKSLESCRLLLRPIIDLSKKEIKEITLLDDYLDYDFKLECFYDYDLGVNYDDGLNSLTYWLHEHLMSMHIDMFGLIEKGLAIDVNTLSNQTELIPYINELNCSERLKNVLNELMYGIPNRKFDNLFNTYTKERIYNTRGMGKKSMKELDQLRIKYNLKYK